MGCKPLLGFQPGKEYKENSNGATYTVPGVYTFIKILQI